jgi:phosphinothricin acetyltransferase
MHADPVTVRLAGGADAADCAAVYAPFVRDTPVSFEESPPSAEGMQAKIEANLMQLPWLVAQRSGAFAGYAYATPHRSRAAYRWAVDTSVYVAAEARRSGVGGVLYRALFAVLSAQGYQRAYAGIALPNPASVGLHEAVGFVPVGVYERVGFKLGRWHDVGWWARTLRDDPVPTEPIPLPELAPGALAAALAITPCDSGRRSRSARPRPAT